jgi:hypothetical protein
MCATILERGKPTQIYEACRKVLQSGDRGNTAATCPRTRLSV